MFSLNKVNSRLNPLENQNRTVERKFLIELRATIIESKKATAKGLKMVDDMLLT